ncbi:MAG: sugar transferase [Actinomycetota bacterium]
MTATPVAAIDASLAPYRGKRLLDLAILAVVGLPALLVGAACAVAVRLSSPGPVLFRQDRIGRDGATFEVLKFRTMRDGDNPIIPDASVITRVGAVLRRLSLDELPQLINVARGEMSVVGPRPTLAYQAERWTDEQRNRLAVRPGLTGLAQVSGRNDLTWPERIEFDLVYVRTQSVRTDLGIVARTATAMLGGEGTGATAADDPIARVHS